MFFGLHGYYFVQNYTFVFLLLRVLKMFFLKFLYLLYEGKN